MELFSIEVSEVALLHAFLNEEILLDTYIPFEKEQENHIILIINNKIAALASLTHLKKHNLSHLYRIDIKHITQPSERVTFPYSIPSDHRLSINEIEKKNLLDLINSSEYSFPFYMNNAEDLFASEQQKIKNLHNKETKQIPFIPNEVITYKNISEPHLRAQFILREIAEFIGINSFIARNDQHRIFKNEFLSSGSLTTIPYDEISNESKKIISLIDVLWFGNDNTLKAAFEIEKTTNFYTALLRFSDVVFAFNVPIDFYIVTTRNREKKLKKELNRPIFVRTGISQRCKIIFLDDLERLYEASKPFKGYLKHNILDIISYNFSSFEEKEKIPETTSYYAN